MAISFHLDEHVDPAIAHGLRLRGIDVTTTAEVGMRGGTDEEQLAYAMNHQRVVFTHDRDFLRLHSQGIEHAGIAFSRQGVRSIGAIIGYLTLIHECLEENEMRGRVEYV